MRVLIIRTDPSPKTADIVPVCGPPNPNSVYRPLLCLYQSGRVSVSARVGAHMPASRMFGQSAPWMIPGMSHQSQFGEPWGEGWRAHTDFSMTAIVFDSPSGTWLAFTVGYFRQLAVPILPCP